MSDDDMLSTVRGRSIWKNWHETVSGTVEGIDKIHYPPDRQAYGSAAINRCTRQIQRSIASAKIRGLGYRAVGRGWSLSEAPLTKGIMLDNSLLQGKKKLRENQLDPTYQGNAEQKNGLCLIQCGNYISEVNEWLESSGQQLSLHTTGAANGQTIVGAMATGTHGSALDYGALHDHVVGLHLLAGESKQYWIERASYPVIKSALPQSLGAELIRDDELFNAVVMSFGAFGIIHNIVIEARPRFLLDSHNYNEDRNGNKLVLDARMRTRIGDLDFTSDAALDPPGESGRPYFFQPIVNPNSNPPEILVTQMHERPWQPGYVPDYRMNQGSFGPGYDFISIAGRALALFQNLVPLFAQLIVQQMFELGKKTGSWGEMFGYKALRTKVASGTVAVPMNKALQTLDILLDLNADIGPVPLVFGCRYVKKSPALLAFNRWDMTFVISIDGIYNDDSLEFFDKIPEQMEANNIPYSQHWGKTNGYTAQRVRDIYGSNVDKWIAARHRLLPDPADRAMFENDYMRDRGLDG